MDDVEMQVLVNVVTDGKKNASDLAAHEFLGLLEGLSRMYSARVWNCVDASGRWDKEWLSLSAVLKRAHKELLAAESSATTPYLRRIADALDSIDGKISAIWDERNLCPASSLRASASLREIKTSPEGK